MVTWKYTWNIFHDWILNRMRYVHCCDDDMLSRHFYLIVLEKNNILVATIFTSEGEARTIWSHLQQIQKLCDIIHTKWFHLLIPSLNLRQQSRWKLMIIKVSPCALSSCRPLKTVVNYTHWKNYIKKKHCSLEVETVLLLLVVI